MGVELADCLSGFGKHLGGTITGGLGSKANCRSMAKPVREIDDFISHDWATWGPSKYITLCFAYNSNAAVIAACVVSIFFGILGAWSKPLRQLSDITIDVGGVSYGIPEVSFFGLASGLSCFVFVLLFWQSIKRVITRKSHTVFLDKLCIDQTDPHKKTRGILSIAGFLKISERLVILWSPRYFSRLWCTYELASWMHQGKSLQKIDIRPVAEGSFLTWVFIGISDITILLVVLATLDRVWFYPLMAIASFLAFILPTHIMRHNIRDLRKMSNQISTFSFHQAECFCCSVGHVIPGTSEVVACDRVIIARKLNKWLRRGPHEDPIESFNSFVRQELGDHMLRRVGGTKIKYFSALAAGAPS
eukprot:TRINITY_DN57063_c0_g1_i1.p1 TRINITY_DN57063_c0_g1~~TRINITY_DN57063_c0_g1_i1.p1  ORF type:complete len:418 (+),score=33.61 TRINITY_DN57063_c0_g1_i1:173-1255(+)